MLILAQVDIDVELFVGSVIASALLKHNHFIKSNITVAVQTQDHFLYASSTSK